jgi:hypothetical protein
MDAGLARAVHGWLAEGASAAEAARRGVALLGGEDVGLIVIGRDDLAAAGSRPMAWAARKMGSARWLGPHLRAK